MPDLHALLSDAMSSRHDPPGTKPVPHPIDRRAQAMELVSRWEHAWQRKAPVMALFRYPRPGILMLERRGLRRYMHDPVLIVWRRLSPWNWQDRHVVRSWHDRYKCDRLDCLVGYLSDGAYTISLEPHSLHMLMPYDPEKETGR